MGEFLENVRNGRRTGIRHPTQRGFSTDQWTKAYNQHSADERDKAVYEVGIWIYSRLQRVREKLAEIPIPQGIPRSTRVLLFCGGLNFSTAEITSKKFPASKEEGYIAEQLIQARIRGNRLGADGSPDEFLPVHIDGGRFSLVFDALKAPEIQEHVSESEEEILRRVQTRLWGGQYYDMLENLWLECLWQGLKLETEDGVDRIVSTDTLFTINLAVSLFRRDSLNSQAIQHIYNLWRTALSRDNKLAVAHVPKVSVTGSGKKKRYSVIFPKEAPDEPPIIAVMRLVVEDRYFADIVNLELPKYPALTVNRLLLAWAALLSLADTCIARFPPITEVKTIGKLKLYSPVFKRADLIPVMSAAAETDRTTGGQILSLFTLEDDPRCDPWTHPLIPVDGSRYAMLVAPPKFGNPLRCIEQWIVAGGLNLDSKGPLFEAHARDTLRQASDAANHLKHTSVVDHSFKLTVAGRTEEIDIVLRMANTVLFCEAKCQVFPTGPMEYQHYFETLRGAARQILRKVEFARSNPEEAIKQLGFSEDVEARKAVFTPAVLTNQSLGVGFPIDGVPIVDDLILTRYLDGKWETGVVFADGQKKSVAKTVQFYESEDEASEKIGDYLSNPPQINFLTQYVQPRAFPIPKNDDSDNEAVRWATEVHLPLPDKDFE